MRQQGPTTQVRTVVRLPPRETPDEASVRRLTDLAPILTIGLRRSAEDGHPALRAAIEGDGARFGVGHLAEVWLDRLRDRIGKFLYGSTDQEGLEARARRLALPADLDALHAANEICDRVLRLKRRRRFRVGATAPALDRLLTATGIADLPRTPDKPVAALIAYRSRLDEIQAIFDSADAVLPLRRLAAEFGLPVAADVSAPEPSSPRAAAPAPAAATGEGEARLGPVAVLFPLDAETCRAVGRLVEEHGRDAIRHLSWMISVRISALRGGPVLTDASRGGRGSVRIGHTLEIPLPGGQWLLGIDDPLATDLLREVLPCAVTEALNAAAWLRSPEAQGVGEAEDPEPRVAATAEKPRLQSSKPQSPKSRTARNTSPDVPAPAPAPAGRPSGRYLTMTQAADRLHVGRRRLGRWLRKAGYLDETGAPTAKGEPVCRFGAGTQIHWKIAFVRSLTPHVGAIRHLSLGNGRRPASRPARKHSGSRAARKPVRKPVRKAASSRKRPSKRG